MRLFIQKSALFTFVLLSLFLVNSCKKDTTAFDKFDNYKPSPEFAIPLFNTNLSMMDIVQNDSVYSKVDANGLVHFIYRQDSIFKYTIGNFFEFDNQNTTSINNTMGDISIADVSNSRKTTLQELSTSFSPTVKAAFDSISGTTTIFPAITESLTNVISFTAFSEFSSISFSQGWLVLKITNKLPVNLSSITVNLYNLSPAQTLLGTYNFSNIAPGVSKSDSISLAGKTLSNSLGYTMPVFNTNSSAPTALLVNYQDSIILTAQGKNLRATSGVATFPTQNIITQNTAVDFTPKDTTQRIRKIIFTDGKIQLKAQSTVSEPIELTINFTNALKNGVAFPSQIITIPTTGSTSFFIDSSISLAGVYLNLTQDIQKPYNKVLMSYSAKVLSSGAPVTFNATDFINLQVFTTSTQIDYIEGYIGVIKVANNNNDFINLSFLKDINEGLNLEDPKLTLTVKNSIGVPAQFQYNFIGKNNSGKTLDAQLQPFDANFPTVAEQGQTKTKVQVYSNANGNGKINELMSLPPHSIQILGQLVTNINPDPTQNQFIKSGTGIVVDVEIDLPLAIKTNNFMLSDTSNLDIGQFNGFSEATLGLNVDNGFPFEVNMKVLFLDSNFKTIDSIPLDNVITSAITDANGRTIQSSISKSKIVLDKVKLKKLIDNKVSKIILNPTMKTENNGQKIIRVYSDYVMKIAIGIIARVKL